MAASFNRWAIVLLVFLCVPSVWAQRVGETSFCEDTGTCRVGEACVAGQCTQLSDNRIRRLFPLAIDRIVNLDAGSRRGPVVDRIRQLLRRYFAFSGYFTVWMKARSRIHARPGGQFLPFYIQVGVV